MRQLEELNLLDDFLVNSLTSHKIYGEPAARCILECILHRRIGKIKVTPQHFVQGEDYGSLRNVFVIFIMTYDPFGRDRMVYTAKNGILEEPDIPYEDGARTIFLYTRGRRGNPPEDLRQLLQYMEHSSKENAKTKDLQRLHEMVTAVKRDGEVGLAYMKSYEIEAKIRREGVAEGKVIGIAESILDLFKDLGEIPPSLREKIMSQNDIEILRKWYKLAAKTESIEAFREQISG